MSMASMKEQTEQTGSLKDNEYIATVVDNADPMGVGRIKINVASIQSISQPASAIWAAPDTVDGGGGGGDATQDIPAIGSKVYVIFQKGDIHFPLYRGAVLQHGVLTPLGADPNIYGWKRGVVQFTADKTSGEIKLTCPNFTLHIDAAGNMTVQGGGALTAQFQSATFNIPDSTFNGNVTITGNQVVDGNQTTQGQTAANGGFTAAEGKPCNLPETAEIGGINIYGHDHTGHDGGGDSIPPFSAG